MKVFVIEGAVKPECLRQQLEISTNTGAIASFTGLMRDVNQGQQIESMYLDHYPGMTEQALQQIADEAAARWPISGGFLAHRVGQVNIQDVLVYVETYAMHRQDSFDACQYIMDMLKTRAPFWKRETTANGSHWVKARTSDQVATEKWQHTDQGNS